MTLSLYSAEENNTTQSKVAIMMTLPSATAISPKNDFFSVECY